MTYLLVDFDSLRTSKCHLLRRKKVHPGRIGRCCKLLERLSKDPQYFYEGNLGGGSGVTLAQQGEKTNAEMTSLSCEQRRLS